MLLKPVFLPEEKADHLLLERKLEKKSIYIGVNGNLDRACPQSATFYPHHHFSMHERGAVNNNTLPKLVKFSRFLGAPL